MIQRITALFPLWAGLLGAAALLEPQPFASLKPAILPLLGVVMFGMGITLTPANFVDVARRPRVIALGTALQFGVMPLAGWSVAQALSLSPQVAAGLVLVGSAPGGTASNVICYLARGDVALSITLTALSTVLAVVATPFLTWWYAGRTVPVPAADMMIDILAVLIVPVILGVAVNRHGGPLIQRFKHSFPLLSVLAICTIIAVVIALNRQPLTHLAAPVALAVVLHNALGLTVGYWVGSALGLGQRVSRTLAIEVGMQNSGLAVALALKYFSAAAALPGALFSIWHNLAGAFLAAYWVRRTRPEQRDPQR